MRSLGLLAATTAFRWTLAIAGGFTAMALLLFAFIYWQTAERERGRIDGLVLSKARSIAEAPGEAAMPALEAWLAEEPAWPALRRAVWSRRRPLGGQRADAAHRASCGWAGPPGGDRADRPRP